MSRFIVKALAVVTILYMCGSLFFTRFSIEIDPQVVKCIPRYSVYLVDHSDQEVQRGKLFAFTSKGLSPIYEDGTRMLKYLKGLPGDEVEISGEQVSINGDYVTYGLSLAEDKLGLPKSKFQGKKILPVNQYWFLGTSHKSFDSRYWGGVTNDQIIGRAYPLF